PDPGNAPERGHQSAVLVPEEMLDEARRCARCRTAPWFGIVAQAPAISRISIRAPGISIGISFATSIARSQLSAVMIMNPPTTSLVSTKAPSVTPDAVTILPPG